MPKEKQVEIVKGDSIFIFSYTGKSTKPERDRFYFWFSRNDIKHTQGDYYGKLLDGKYVLTDRSRQLLEKGDFKRGLKDGEWFVWYKNGMLLSVETWDRGLRDGEFKKYDENGRLKVTGEFKEGLLDGAMEFYEQDSLLRTEIYRKGKLLQDNRQETDLPPLPEQESEKDTVNTDLTELTN